MTDVGRSPSGGSPAGSQNQSPTDATPPTSTSDHAPPELSTGLPSLTKDETKGKIQSSTGEDDIVTRTFQFLSTATPATLGAIAVALAAITYFILGRIGLLLIGAFAGVTSFVIWESQHPEVARAVRGEKRHAFLDRLLDNTYGDVGAKLQYDEEKDLSAALQSFDDFQPETRIALHELVDAVIRDYVDWWYGPIVPSDKSFPLACRRTFTQFILSFSNRLRRKRPADAFVDFVTHSCSIVIVFFSEMAAAYTELPADTNMTAADAIYNYLATHTEAPLSNLLNQRQQAAKFKMVAEDLLGFLEKSTYDCDPARAFLREILSTIILEGTLQTCSKADWINGWIVYLLESGETDLSQAIDEAIQDQKAFGDVDGNVGNIGLSRGNRNSYELDRQRRKDMVHKKKLSKADEEMEKATEEMKRLNEMIEEADRTKPALQVTTSEASNSQNNIERNGKRDSRMDLEGGRMMNSISSKNGSESTPDSLQMDNTDAEHTSNTAISTKLPADSSNQPAPPINVQELAPAQTFTNFDQLVPPPHEEDGEDSKSTGPPPLTIHNASITIHDDTAADSGRLRNKPSWEYLLQIEPSSSHHSGWMIMKTYMQFEGLHESLRRIANVSGATAFLEAHSQFPSWKLHTRSSLRGELERYMRNACSEKALAESEAMKRFLDKGQDAKMGINRGFSFESMGKGMLDVIQNAPKGALDSGKVVMGGVTGVFGNIGLGPKRSTNASLQQIETAQGSGSRSPSSTRPVSLPVLPRADTSPINGSKISRDSLDSQRSSIVSVQPSKIPPMDGRRSSQADLDLDSTLHPARADRWERKSSVSAASSRVHSRASSAAAARSPFRSPSEASLSNLNLPPPPNEITDDYGSPTSTRLSLDSYPRLSNSFNSPIRTSIDQPMRALQTNGAARRPVKHFPPLSEQETRVAIELLFAVITELYTLSSAWNIRRTLLTAAKSFLLRPGNPSLVSIQSLIQSSLLDANTSDDGLATHIRKLRENSLPTEEERKAWPAELTATEKEELREKARKLFIQSSVPAALMGIMGQSATNEALGRVFDCLQIEEVARGLFFGLILQAVRVVTH
ncbi:PXA domain-containing protein [Xylaria bambusicola]|uniref:PXA domain-containing protein n=1 Tax=Xylaria bambusicola TaxID=326684 RepID=UPI0020084E75|nr:PXA domain-containing protein [Xylaria bambusicola]KAI0509414.1 PXA domain-containing protein [Xylaria bambusicola]